MKWLWLTASIVGTLAAFLAACFFIATTQIWLVRHSGPAPWVVGMITLALLGTAVTLICRWWRLPAERRFRFSLRGMLVAITLFALWLGTAGVNLPQWGRREYARRDIIRNGGHPHMLLVGEISRTRLWLFRITGCDPWWKADWAEPATDQAISALLRHEEELSQIQVLSFRAGVTDAGLKQCDQFDRFPRLQYCSVESPLVTDRGLKHLAQWKSLRGVTLEQCAGITDAGLAHLTTLPNLKRLSLRTIGPKSMPITDAGLAHVARMTHLETLNIYGPITDAGIQHLHGLVNLKELWLSTKTKVTEDGYQKLCQALPNCLVRWNGLQHPNLSQIRQIEVWHRQPEQSPIAVITAPDQIAAVKTCLEQLTATTIARGGHDEVNHGPSPAPWTLRFEGPQRRLEEIPFGNGVLHSSPVYYSPLLPAEEEKLRTLLTL